MQPFVTTVFWTVWKSFHNGHALEVHERELNCNKSRVTGLKENGHSRLFAFTSWVILGRMFTTLENCCKNLTARKPAWQIDNAAI